MKTVVIGMCALFSLQAHAQYSSSPIEQLDKFYLASSVDPDGCISFMTETAMVTTITYNDSGQSEINTLSRSEYIAELQKLHADYKVKQAPVVVLERGYGGLHTTYSSIYTSLTDTNTGDNILIKSIQTAHIVFENAWKINHLTVQNENPANPIGDDLWPRELIKDLIPDHANTTSTSNGYDPDKVYSTDEVDLAPTYPGSDESYEDLLASFGIKDTATEGYISFTVTINEDGLAELGYVNDLSEDQIEKAKRFVNAMLIWYPAEKDEASVNCKLVYYIK